MGAMVTEGEQNTLEYAKDGETLFVDYTFEEDGYVETDDVCGYGKGTGAWVETSKSLQVTDAEVMDADGELRPFEVDEKRLMQFVA